MAACAMLACTRETSRGPVAWTASNPSSATGQTASQAWSRSTSSDTAQPAPAAPSSTSQQPAEAAHAKAAVEPPPGALLTAGTAVEGTDRVYDSPLPYRQTVDFFDRKLSADGCGYTERSLTVTATAWTVRCSTGETARVSVQNGRPATIEIIQATRHQQETGVTSSQP